nr:hypothetical protein [Tanacetum cinerariifolium]
MERELVECIFSFLVYTSHHLDRFTSGSSSGHSSSDRSSSGHSISGHSLSEHTSPDTTVADSSTPPSFVYPPLARTPRSGDSSSESSAGPFRKRCRSPTATVTSPIPDMRALVPSCTDFLPLRKRFRDSISLEDSVEEGIDTNVLENIKADATVDVGIDVEDEVESSDRGTMEVGVDVVVEIDIPDEIPLQRIDDIETGQRELKARSLIFSGERASLLEQVASLDRSNMRLRGTMMMESARADRLVVEPVGSSSISVNQVPHYGLNVTD